MAAEAGNDFWAGPGLDIGIGWQKDLYLYVGHLYLYLYLYVTYMSRGGGNLQGDLNSDILNLPFCQQQGSNKAKAQVG